MVSMSRREALFGASALGIAMIGGTAAIGASARAKPAMTMYRSEGCGCCLKWAEIAKAAGYPVAIRNVDDVMAVKARLGVPDQLAACHTTVVGGYVVEGHVPFEAVAALLRKKPSGIVGIAVPGMPAGSPGMEVPGHDHGNSKFAVTAFGGGGRTAAFAY